MDKKLHHSIYKFLDRDFKDAYIDQIIEKDKVTICVKTDRLDISIIIDDKGKIYPDILLISYVDFELTRYFPLSGPVLRKIVCDWVSDRFNY